MAKREKKGYSGPKLVGDNAEYRKKRAKKNAPENVISNEVFATTDTEFQDACTKAGIPATARQAGKWRNGYGKALQAVGRGRKAA